MTETPAEEIKRLQQEIAQRQARISELLLGDPRRSVSLPQGPSYHHREDCA